MNTSIEHEPVNSIRSGNLHVRVFFLLAYLIGVISLLFLLLGGLPTLEPPKVHAQDEGTPPVNRSDKDTVHAIPRSPGARARYIVNFLNSEKELLPEQDGIVFRVDSHIGLPDKIKAGEIDIHYTDIQVSFGAPTYSVAEGNSVKVTVTRSAGSEGQVTIPLTTTGQVGANSSDYRDVPASLTFESGKTSRDINFTATAATADNADNEGNDGKSVVLRFGTLPEGVRAGTHSQATVSITETADPPPMTVSFVSSGYSVPEGSSVTVTVTLSAGSEVQVTIPLTTPSQVGASASDYSGVPAELDFGIDETSRDITFTAAADNVDDDGESVVLSFGELPTGVSKRTPSEATVSIIETPEPYGSGQASSVDITSPEARGGPVTLTIYHKVKDDGDKAISIPPGASVEVKIHEDAGLSNPIEGGAYQWEIGTTHDSEPFYVAQHPDLAVRNAFRRMEEAIGAHVDEADLDGLLVDWEVELSKPTLRRGDQLEITGRGFAVGTTVIFWRDSNMNGVFDALGAVLCRAESDSRAVAKCSIPVTNPPFVPGFGDCTFDLKDYDPGNSIMVGIIDVNYEESNCNFINARDGQGHSSILLLEEETGEGITKKDNVEDAFQVLELTGSVDLGALLPPHPTVRVELADFPQGHLESVALGGFRADLTGVVSRQISERGSLNFPLMLPGFVLPGRQDIRITVEKNVGDCAREVEELDEGYCHEHHSEVTVDNSLHVEVTPSTALPNQRVRLTIQGFQGTDIGRISMDGIKILGAEDCEDEDELIQLDSSGRWVGSVVLPVNGSTLLGGERKLQVRDCQRRLGETVMVFPPREIQVSPAQAVPGETVTISGEGFPVSSDRGSEFRVEVTYDYGEGQFTTSVSIDANGRFSTDINVPRAAGVPSSNLVSAEFMDDDGHAIYTNTAHLVTAATVTASPDHGPPGTTINVIGRGFRPFTPVTRVLMGEVDVTPSPAPHSDANGMVEFEVLVPQSDVGLESIFVLAGGIYVLADFQVGRPLAETGPLTPIEELTAILGENFLVSFHFGNDTKEWTFHEPSFPEEGGLEFLVPGESYYVQVRENTAAILNGKTRHLSCREGNCWNLITW